MMSVANANAAPIYDEKVKQILGKLSEGKSREKVAEELGYNNYKSMDMYIRRRNFIWSQREQTYIPAQGIIQPADLEYDSRIPSKVDKAIYLFKQKSVDAQEIAKQLGFHSRRELAQYMSDKGYQWSSEKGNYVRGVAATVEQEQPAAKESEPESLDIESFLPLLQSLRHHKDRLLDMLASDSESGRMPRYVVPGVLTTKSVHMSHLLDKLSREYSREKNISQRDLFEVALVEFFQKYGYRREIERLLQNRQ